MRSAKFSEQLLPPQWAPKPGDVVTCRGCWEFGTACGKCPRCIATRPQPQRPAAPPISTERVAYPNGIDWHG